MPELSILFYSELAMAWGEETKVALEVRRIRGGSSSYAEKA